ncbi:MAG: 50S ribosomal protein L11 methyltransferase [Clostridiales bacterium]|nr:50S ribosomal protein L11 methyltransferase [Candidatus Crickella caballi]
MKYIELKIHVKKDAMDIVTAALEQAGFNSLMIDDPEDVLDIMSNREKYRYDYIDAELTDAKSLQRDPLITLYFTDDEDGAEELARAESIVSEYGIHKLLSYETNISDDQDWLYKWQEYFKPTKVSERIVVKPTWEDYETKDNELVIEIDPGMAFGTGTHETTSMCIKALEQVLGEADEEVKLRMTEGSGAEEELRTMDGSGAKVLDVGCGSGILAIAAALLGAEEALGIEIDTDAVEIAKSNVELNGQSEKIRVQYGDLTQGVDYKADIVVANLMADLVIALTPDVPSHMKEGGVYISSGILVEKEAIVSAAIEQAGFTIARVLYDGEWCAIIAKLS